jgi:hypothetical protein
MRISFGVVVMFMEGLVGSSSDLSEWNSSSSSERGLGESGGESDGTLNVFRLGVEFPSSGGSGVERTTGVGNGVVFLGGVLALLL